MLIIILYTYGRVHVVLTFAFEFNWVPFEDLQ